MSQSIRETGITIKFKADSFHDLVYNLQEHAISHPVERTNTVVDVTHTRSKPTRIVQLKTSVEMKEHSKEPLQHEARSSDETSPDLFNFTHSSSLSPFTVSSSEYVSNHRRTDSLNIPFIAVGALVFINHTQVTNTSLTPTSSPSEPRILLVQRASTDSLPLRWEVPGGACDATDATILHSCARELHEEAGLAASHIHCLVQTEPEQDGDVFMTSTGNIVCKYSFLVSVRSTGVEVKLDPNEHQDFVWATEDEVMSENAQGRELKFTFPEQKRIVVKGFEIWKKIPAQKESETERS